MGGTGQTPQEQADAHKGQQWHKYLGWVDAKLTPKQLLKEEKKAKREAEKKRKKEGVTELQGFQPVFYKDLAKSGEAAGEELAEELAVKEREAAAAAEAKEQAQKKADAAVAKQNPSKGKGK